MKKIILIINLLFFFSVIKGQDCIDAVIYNVTTDYGNVTDTMFCRVLNEDEYSYTVDNGYAISSITKNIIKEIKYCIREMTVAEIYRYKGLDQVTRDYFKNTNTVGSYFRKASFSSYFGIGLCLGGATTIILGATIAENDKTKAGCIIGGAVVTAVGVFLVLRAWNQVYKAGKIMDINNMALYFDSTPEGNMGFLLKF